LGSSESSESATTTDLLDKVGERGTDGVVREESLLNLGLGGVTLGESEGNGGLKDSVSPVLPDDREADSVRLVGGVVLDRIVDTVEAKSLELWLVHAFPFGAVGVSSRVISLSAGTDM
jgi:hypothetical protein